MTLKLNALLAAAAAPLLLAACGSPEPAAGETETANADVQTGEAAPEAQAEAPEAAGPETGSLEWAVAGDWRGESAARDEWRHPVETLRFFGVDPSTTVIEITPGGGWYTQVLAPWINANGGTYVAAHFPTDSEARQRVVDNYLARFSGEPYGEIEIASFGPDSEQIVAPGTADYVLTFRNTHGWLGGGYAEKAFADFYAALKPGGVLGLVQHRLPSTAEQDPRAGTGYVQQDYVIAMAEEAGFVLEEASEINANPADTADHPFGVWTLQPVARTSPFGEDPDPEFDRAPYDAIGESDRMTLRFRKPAETAAPADDASGS